MAVAYTNGRLMTILALLAPMAEAKSSGSGMGGMYWAIAVLIILVIGVVGYVIFQYWKSEMLKERALKESAAGKKNAIQSYEESKLEYFQSHFQKDLDLAAKKKGLILAPAVAAAVDFARAGERKKVFDLIDRGDVDVNATDTFGRNLLMIGAEIGDSRLCDGILRRGVDVNARNKFNGATVLHFAYQANNDSLGLSLVARGADDTVRAIDGRTCYQLHEEAYDVEAGGDPGARAPAARRPGNKMEHGGQGKRKTGGQSKGGTRRNSQGRVERDKSGNPIDYGYNRGPPQMGTAYDKMGDAYTQSTRLQGAYDKMGDPRQGVAHPNEFSPAYDMPGAIPDKYRR